MEQIDNCCHRFERLNQQRHQQMSTIIPVDPHISTVAYQSLDTVRALHQTVVYLRKALEKAHREIDSLKKQINVKDDIDLGKKYREQEVKKHLDDIFLNIDLSEVNDNRNDKNDDIKLQAQSIRNAKIDSKNNETKAFDEHSAHHQSTESLNSNPSASSRKTTTAKHTHSTEHHFQHSLKAHEIHLNHQLIGHPIHTNFKEKQTNSCMADTSTTLSNQGLPQMASKIDVKIKLTSNFQIDGNDTSSETTGDSVSGILYVSKFCSYISR